MYQVPASPDERPGCRDTWVLTIAMFAIVIPPLLAMLGVITLLFAAILAYAAHPALVLLPIGLLLAGVALFVRWERGRGGSSREEF